MSIVLWNKFPLNNLENGIISQTTIMPSTSIMVTSLVMGLFDGHFVLKHSIIFDWAHFHLQTQDAVESVEQHLCHLYELAAHYDFSETEEETCDRLAKGIKNKEFSLKIQMTSD